MRRRPDACFGHPGLRSLHAGFTSPSGLRSPEQAGSIARAAPPPGVTGRLRGRKPRAAPATGGCQEKTARGRIFRAAVSHAQHQRAEAREAKTGMMPVFRVQTGAAHATSPGRLLRPSWQSCSARQMRGGSIRVSRGSGLPTPSRRTLAAVILTFAPSETTALSPSWLRLPSTPARGDGQTLAEFTPSTAQQRTPRADEAEATPTRATSVI